MRLSELTKDDSSPMSDTTFYYIIGGLAAILAVLLFNSYKEKRYRDEVRRQFGHSDQDA